MAPMNNRTTFTAWLFDLYPQGDSMILWFLAEDGRRVRLVEPFAPSFYVDVTSTLRPGATSGAGECGGAAQRYEQRRGQLRAALERCAGLELIGTTERLDFWTARPREVEEVRVTDLDRYGANLRALARRHPEWTYYHCDIPAEIHYCYERGLFPTGLCEVEHDGGRLVRCRLRDDARATQYPLLPLREIELRAEGIGAGRRPRMRSLSLTHEGRTITWDEATPAEMLRSLRDCLREIDPDLIWTTGGDSVLMPALFAMAGQYKIGSLGLDRERGVERELVYDGRTYISYGRVLYQAPDYPLLGRWHIDRNNSFWTAEAGLEGLLEVARMSKIPVQRAARRSIGTGISSIQLDTAYRDGYLIPWKKSQSEAWKTAATLLLSDRGGLVFQPVTGVYENIVELDFASMYPTIMVRDNISPETINCSCCEAEPGIARVPELGYTICRRRRGLVSKALEPIIAKRAEYKLLRREAEQAGEAGRELYERYDRRQSALKWLLVCCFGYLGYRNARFGRIEAHESTCAISREKLLIAREICGQHGFDVIHSIVDCVWLRRAGANPGGAQADCGRVTGAEPGRVSDAELGRISDAEIARLCAEINRATNLTITLEGQYRWLVFLPSRRNPEMPVPNRYFGCFEDGKLKYRGIEIRRSDQAPCAKALQGELLEMLREAQGLAECRAMREPLIELVRRAVDRLRYGEAALEDVVLRRKTSKAADEYRNNSMTAVAARQAVRAGIPLHAGEAIRFVVLDAGNVDPDSRVRVLSLLRPEDAYDPDYYIEQIRRAAATILEPLLAEPPEEFLSEFMAALPGNKSHETKSEKTRRTERKKAAAREEAAGAKAGIVQLDLFAGAK